MAKIHFSNSGIRNFLSLLFILMISLSVDAFASRRTDRIFKLVENENVPAETIKKELAKSSTLYTATSGSDKETLLMVALKNNRDIDVITVLLNAGVDPEKKSRSKKTALMFACRYSTDVNVVEKVLKTQAWLDFSKKRRILKKDRQKMNCFDYTDLNVSPSAQKQIMELLLKYAKRPEKEFEEKKEPEEEIKPVEEIIEKEPESIVEKPAEVIEEKPVEIVEEKPVEEVPEVTPVEVIPVVVPVVVPEEKKEEEPQPDEEEKEPEPEPVEKKEEPKPIIPPPPSIEIEEDNEERVIVSDVNQQDEFGRTKLMIAARDGNVELVKDLLFSGAITDICDNEGCTALMYGTRYQKNPEILQILLSHNANFRTTSESGMSALMFAVTENPEKEFVRILIGSRIASETDLQAAFIKAVIAEDSEEVLDLFVRHGVSVNLMYDGCTPLMYAAKTNKKTNTIKWLLKKGASRTDRTTDGKNAADFAAGNTNLPHDGVYKALSKY